MAGAVATLTIVLGAALVLGQALAAIAAGASRARPLAFTWLAPAYGLAVLILAGGIAVRLPGHATTAAIALGVLTVAAAAWLRGRTRGRPGALAVGLPVVVITVAAAVLPFAIAGSVGVLGAGLVNDDMASHLIIADYNYVFDPRVYLKRFFQQQYKRNCVPDGPKVGSISLSPRGDLRMPSDMSGVLWHG